jgi:transposase-like protein
MGYPSLRLILEKLPTNESCLVQLARIRGRRGPGCPKCNSRAVNYAARTKAGKIRKVYQCGVCGRQFSATAGTLFHDSHMPLTQWFLLIYLMDSSKMRISAKEVERMLGVGYETAWTMHRRIAEAMKDRDLKEFLQRLIGVYGCHYPGYFRVISQFPPPY